MVELDPERDLDHDFEDDDGNMYNYDQYKIGDLVQWLDEDEKRWYVGTLVRIDYFDRSLPWGVTTEPVTLLEGQDYDLDDGENTVGWSWRVPTSVRPDEYVISEEDEWTSTLNVLAKAK